MWKGLVVAVLLAEAVAQNPPSARSMKDVAWLAGCWSNVSEGRQIDEQWMSPAGGTMLGMSRTVSKGRVITSEFVQLREEGSDVYYVAKPVDQKEAKFKLTESQSNRVRFENPSHDFPQTITYTLAGGGKLLAQIQGTVNGKSRTIDYPMERRGCL